MAVNRYTRRLDLIRWKNFNLGAVIGLNITGRCGGWGMGEEDDKPPDWQIRCGAQKVNVNLKGQERVQTADYLLNLYNKKGGRRKREINSTVFYHTIKKNNRIEKQRVRFAFNRAHDLS